EQHRGSTRPPRSHHRHRHRRRRRARTLIEPLPPRTGCSRSRSALGSRGPLAAPRLPRRPPPRLRHRQAEKPGQERDRRVSVAGGETRSLPNKRVSERKPPPRAHFPIRRTRRLGPPPSCGIRWLSRARRNGETRFFRENVTLDLADVDLEASTR